MKKNIYLVVVILIIIAGFIFYPKQKTLKFYPFELEVLKIDIDGEVHKPGTYQIERGKTLGFLINTAGGLTPNADISNINLSEILTSKTYFINAFEIKYEEPIKKKNLNEISYEELITIPYITKDIALEILIYKKSNGNFTDIRQLLLIKGIGEKKLEKITTYIFI